MKPLNFPLMHDRMKTVLAASKPRTTESAEIYNILHGCLSTAAEDPAEISPDEICHTMLEILGLCAMHDWQLGFSLASVAIPDRTRSNMDLVMEAHVGISLAYGAEIQPDGVSPSFFLAIAFRHLMTLGDRLGIELADSFDEMFSRLTAS